MQLSFVFSFLLLSASFTVGGIIPFGKPAVSQRADVGQKLVFSHFMIGVVSDRTSAAEYDDDMKRAKEYGIDAFALNIGTDNYTDTQLDFAYESAASNDMKVFISFDFNWWNSSSDATAVGQKVAQYANKDAQLKVGEKAFVSSFAGSGLDTATVRAAAGLDLYLIPNFNADQDLSGLDGAMNWIGWQNDGNNKAPSGGNTVTVADGDNAYLNALGEKPYMAPVSPWFFTHFGAEVEYSKNWVFPGDLLWYARWTDILRLAPDYVEIITWNDYGESHYVGPLASKHTDDGGSKWVNDMPHNGWLEMAKPFIAAYKAGETDVGPHIDSDQIVYWYRPTPASTDCDATDTTMEPADNSTGNYFMGRPNGWETLTDSVFIVPLLTAAGTVTVNSGGTVYNIDAPAGASSWSVPMGLGAQAFSLSRDGAEVISATSLKEIKDECVCGIYNFNSYVGTVPEGPSDPLGEDGLTALTTGLKTACEAAPSLPATPPATVAPTATGTATAGPTAA